MLRSLLTLKSIQTTLFRCRKFQSIVRGTEKCSEQYSRGLVLGVYADEKDKYDPGRLTEVGEIYNTVCTKIGLTKT